MRLTCPNCGTEYEVPGDLIPEDGKHVQCSGCHTRWFVRGGETALLSEEQIIHRLESWSPRPVGVPTAPPPETATVTEVAAEAESAPEIEARKKAELAPDPGEEPQAPPEPAPEPEQETEPAAVPEPDRAAPAPSEPDLKPDLTSEPAPKAKPEPDTPRRSAPRPASPRPLTAEPEATTDDLPETFIWEHHDGPKPVTPSWREPAGGAQNVPRPGQQARPSQRLELPRATTAAAPVFDDPPPTRSRFWRGVTVSLLLAGLTLAAYVWRDGVTIRWPVFEPALNALAGWIDAAREWAETWLGPLRAR